MLSGTTSVLLLAGLTVGACGPRAPTLSAADLAPVGKVADFTLTDQDGAAFSAADLAGKVWVVDFFFTSCPSFCPLLTGAMSALAREHASTASLRFLSITVDPGTDTPEVLRAFAEREGLPQQRWRLLSGKKEDIVALCEQSFRLAFGELDGATGDITHSSRLVLVDSTGNIRGYFDALDPAQQGRLREAINVVLAESQVR